ncbi:hypothetical protein HDU79_007142 [Rhizoclosmatium sp. JEL0117]|nr:hypothetical protein HDU79_007142 [Rhizoclosmatium sp. JEL0117]
MSETFTLLIGSNSRHLGQVTFDATANHLSLSETKEIGHRPSWIHIHKSVLVTNIEDDIGKVVVFDGPSTPNDNLLNLSGLVHRFEVESGGADPCHLDVSKDGTTLFAANYNGGTVSFHSLKDGSNERILDFRGFRPNKIAHPHMAIMNPFEPSDSPNIYITDLGSDYLHIVHLDPTTSKPIIKSGLEFPSGSGPRHITFHPSGTIAYVNLELHSTLAVISLVPSLSILSTHSLKPPSVPVETPMQSAAIILSPDARFLYLSNRGDPSKNDTVVHFPLDQIGLVSGAPTWTKTDGFWVRGMGMSPSGDYLCVGNQETDSLVMFKRSNEDGSLEKVASLQLEDGFKPTCAVWL